MDEETGVEAGKELAEKLGGKLTPCEMELVDLLIKMNKLKVLERVLAMHSAAAKDIGPQHKIYEVYEGSADQLSRNIEWLASHIVITTADIIDTLDKIADVCPSEMSLDELAEKLKKYGIV